MDPININSGHEKIPMPREILSALGTTIVQ